MEMLRICNGCGGSWILDPKPPPLAKVTAGATANCSTGHLEELIWLGGFHMHPGGDSCKKMKTA